MIETKREDTLVVYVTLKNDGANKVLVRIQNGKTQACSILNTGTCLINLLDLLLIDIPESTAWLEAIQQAIKDTTPEEKE